MALSATAARRAVTAALLAPAALWLSIFLVLPFLAILVFSFGERAPEGGYQAAFTLAQYANLASRAAAFWNTLTLAPIGALACLVVAYPVAYWLAVMAPPRQRLLLVSLVVVPFWTSLLVRTYAWMYILGSRGIPNLLAVVGIEDVRLLNTPGAVLLGIVYGYLPLMIMPIYVSLEKLDRRLLEASADLGARPLSTFLGVTLPLSLPGVMTGVALVTILLLGEYLIPQLLGGGKVFFIGNALVDLFLQSRNWPFGSAIAVTLVVVVVVVLLVAMRIAWRVSGTRQWISSDARARHGGLRLPLRAHRPGGAVLLQRRTQRQRVHWFLGRLVRQGALQPLPHRGARQQPDRGLLQRRRRGGLRNHGRPRHGAPRPARPRGVRRPVRGRHRGAGRRNRHRHAGRARPALRLSEPPDGGRLAGRDAAEAGLGFFSIIAAHGLFSMALVTMIVKARLASLGRDIVEASADLYATPLTTFRSIVLPQIAPAILAGFLLAFTFSFDDFIVAFFVAGSKTTLPIYVFASIRRGVTPEVNVIATLVLLVSLALILTSRALLAGRRA